MALRLFLKSDMLIGHFEEPEYNGLTYEKRMANPHP